MQNRQKMALEEPRMDPKWIQNREKGVQMTKMAQDGVHEWSGSMMRHPGHIFGSPWGAQKSPKIDFFPKKPSQGALFHRFLQRMSFSSIFRLIFSRFWMKNQWKKACFFQAPRAFFPTWRPSRNTVFYDTKATFSFFEFLIFFKKLMKKMAEKFICQKSRKMTPGGSQNRPKILKKWSQNRQKSPKLPKKSIF